MDTWGSWLGRSRGGAQDTPALAIGDCHQGKAGLRPKWVQATFGNEGYRPTDAARIRAVARRGQRPAGTQGCARCLVRRVAPGELVEHGRRQTALWLYASASIVASDRIVFNIRGNAYRLVVAVDFEKRIVWIKWLGTHRDYDRIDAKEVDLE